MSNASQPLRGQVGPNGLWVCQLIELLLSPLVDAGHSVSDSLSSAATFFLVAHLESRVLPDCGCLEKRDGKLATQSQSSALSIKQTLREMIRPVAPRTECSSSDGSNKVKAASKSRENVVWGLLASPLELL